MTLTMPIASEVPTASADPGMATRYNCNNFMPPLRFAPYRQIASEIAAFLAERREGADPLAPWPAEVLVPSRGVAQAITAALAGHFPQGIASLRLHTPEELASRLTAAGGQFARIATDGERRLAMRVAVRSVEDPLVETRGMAGMLERAWRDMRDGGLQLADVARRASAARGLRNAARTDAIVRTWREYERLIAQLGAIDPADRLAAASRLVGGSTPPQLVAGFYDMTGAQLRLLESLLRAGRVEGIWVPADAPFVRPFVRTIASHVDVLQDPALEIRAPHATATAYETRTAEIRSVCADIAALLAAGEPAGEIGIVARSLEPHDVALIRRFARERGFATTLRDEMPLAAHRVARGAITLLRLRERGFARSDVFELLRDGLRVRTRIDIDEADAATRRATIAGGTSEELTALRGRSRVLGAYVDLVAELETLSAAVDLDLLTRLPGLFRLETALDLAAAAKLDEIAALFARTSVWNRGFDVISVIDAIQHETLPLPETATALPAVWAGDLMRFRGRSFRHLFVINMGDEVFPQRRAEDPLLPDHDRNLLGIRAIGDGSEEELLLFSLLHDATSGELRFSFPAGDGFGNVLRPSRYLRAIPRRTVEPLPPGAGEARPPSRRQLQLLARAGTASVFDGTIGALPGALAAKLTALSPTQLEDFGECPQKFLLKHLLGAFDVDDPERELQINPREKGTLDHAILERFYRSLSELDFLRAKSVLPRLPGEIAARLEEAIDAEFDEVEREAPPFNHAVRAMERRATKRLLAEFVAADLADLDASGLKPAHFEYRFGAKHREAANHPDPYVVDADGVPLRVEGTVDRIDTGGARFRIVDYKSGKGLRHANLAEKIDRGVRLQLALYAMAVAEFFDAAPENVNATIKPLVAGDRKPESFAFELGEKRERVLETLAIFMRAIRAGTFPAFPIETADINSCRYCPVNHSCRTHHDPDERQALARHGDPRTLLGGSS